MKTRILLMTLLAIAVGLTTTSCKQNNQQTNTVQEYPMLTVQRTTKTINQEYTASIEGCNDVDIYPQVSGTITKICVREGAKVTKGQTLFIIDQVPYRANVQSAEASVESAKANLESAKLTLDSKQKLYDEKVGSNYDLRQARNSYLSAKASLSQAQADLTKARNDLSYTVVKSPVSGVAGMINLREGALVSETMSNPLMTVTNDSQMYVYFSLTEEQVLSMSKGKDGGEDATKIMPSVTLRTSDGDTYNQPGKIDAFSGIVDKTTGSVRVRATFQNPQHVLRSGGVGTIVVPRTMSDVILVPQKATFEIQDKIYVYKVVDGKTKDQIIKIVETNDGENYIVTDGLKPGDVIISDGAGLLKNDMEVKEKKQ